MSSAIFPAPDVVIDIVPGLKECNAKIYQESTHRTERKVVVWEEVLGSLNTRISLRIAPRRICPAKHMDNHE